MSAEPVEPPRHSARPSSVARLADAVRALGENERTIADIHALATRMELTKLVPVAAELNLLAQLDDLVGQARRLIEDLADGGSAQSRHTTAALLELVNRPLWAVARRTLGQLQEQQRTLDEYVRVLMEDRAAYGLPFQKFHDVVGQADGLGVQVSKKDRILANEVWNRFRSSDVELSSGRYDTMAVTVEFAKSQLKQHGLSAPGKLEKRRQQIEKKIAEASDTQRRRAARAELFVLTGSPADGDVPVTVMMRRPSYANFQETNLYEDFTMLKMDQDLFRDIIEQITDVALRGLRKASPTDSEVPAPGAPVSAGLLADQAVPDPPAADPPTAETLSADPAGDQEDAGPDGQPGPDPGTQPTGTRRAEPGRLSLSPELLAALEPARRLEMIGRRMYSLLIPDAMQRLIDENPGVSLTITSNNPELPWELLHDGRKYLALERMMARMPTGQTFPRRVRDLAIPSGGQKRVLLISSGTPEDLPEAIKEIDEIEEELQQVATLVTITKLVGKDVVTSSRLTDELSLGNYDLVHYAGHAGFDRRRPERSFLLLPNGERFRAERVQRLIEGHPIVFLNA